MSKKTITIADILNRIRNIKYVMMHKDGGTKYLSCLTSRTTHGSYRCVVLFYRRENLYEERRI